MYEPTTRSDGAAKSAGSAATSARSQVNALAGQGYAAQQKALSPQGKATVAAAALNVRAGPSSQAARQGELKKGDTVDVTGRSGDWLGIPFQGGAGYVHGGYVTFEPAAPTQTTASPSAAGAATTPAPTSASPGLIEQAGQAAGEVAGTAWGWLKSTYDQYMGGTPPTTAGDAGKAPVETPVQQSELELLMAKDRLSIDEIAKARDLISKEPAEKQADLYLALQSKSQYANQRDNTSAGETSDGGMCNLTSLAMCLQYLGVPNPHPEMQYEDALEKVRIDNKFGARTTFGGWGKVAEHLGVTPVSVAGEGTYKRDFWKATVRDKHLAAGEGVMMSISGHIVRLQGVTDDGLIVDDPYGSLTLQAGGEHAWKWSATNASDRFDKDPSKKKANAGEDCVWAWENVEVHTMRWIYGFKK